MKGGPAGLRGFAQAELDCKESLRLTGEVVYNCHSLDKPGGCMHAGVGGSRRQSLGSPEDPHLGPWAVPLVGGRSPDPWGA